MTESVGHRTDWSGWLVCHPWLLGHFRYPAGSELPDSALANRHAPALGADHLLGLLRGLGAFSWSVGKV